MDASKETSDARFEKDHAHLEAVTHLADSIPRTDCGLGGGGWYSSRNDPRPITDITAFQAKLRHR